MQRELRCVVVVGRVDACVAGGNKASRKSGRELEDVAYPLGAAAGGTEAVVAVELKVDVVGVVVPFLLGEEGTEGGDGAEGGGFVGAEVHHGSDVEGGEVEVWGKEAG